MYGGWWLCIKESMSGLISKNEKVLSSLNTDHSRWLMSQETGHMDTGQFDLHPLIKLTRLISIQIDRADLGLYREWGLFVSWTWGCPNRSSSQVIGTSGQSVPDRHSTQVMTSKGQSWSRSLGYYQISDWPWNWHWCYPCTLYTGWLRHAVFARCLYLLIASITLETERYGRKFTFYRLWKLTNVSFRNLNFKS